MIYKFENPLKEAVILRRNSQFTMDVIIDGNVVKCHCPTTGRIGDVEIKNIACLISESNDTKRKLKYTVEAISCDNLNDKNKRWIGINQILSNRLVEFFLQNHMLDKMVKNYENIRREVNIGLSKLDFLVGNTYIEVKTPLNTLHVEYSSNIKIKKVAPFSSTERFVKHINELANSLKIHERAIMLTVHQYEATKRKDHLKSTNYHEVKEAMENAIAKGLETWTIDMNFTREGVKLASCINTTDKLVKD